MLHLHACEMPLSVLDAWISGISKSYLQYSTNIQRIDTESVLRFGDLLKQKRAGIKIVHKNIFIMYPYWIGSLMHVKRI